MDIAKKKEYAKLYIDNIAKHDDAPAEEVDAALVELSAYADAQRAEMAARRAAGEGAPQ